MTEKQFKISPEFAKALIKAQSEMTNPKKDSKNPFFKSSYADLGAVREASIPQLNSNGIAVLQPTGANYVKTVLIHESGEILDLECNTQILFAKPNDAQAQGSGITYARRYGLQSLLTLTAEDDDGNSASEKPKLEAKKQPTKNAFGLSKEGDLASGKDMQETQIEENKKLVERLIARINQMGSSAELSGWLEEKAVTSAYSKLEKYLPDGFAEVRKAELAMFEKLDPND